jgi:Na+-translocating ferredoxin:NAD+ oxidoreductase RnfC subunit
MTAAVTAVDLAREAGLVGAGGGGFPTHVKLSLPADVVIANAAECEPLGAKDTFLVEREAETVLRGLRLAGEVVCARRLVVAAKPKRERAWRALNDALGDGVGLLDLPDAYPVGDEVTLVKIVAGRTVPRGGLPADVGALVQNVETLYNLARAEATPVTGKWVAVAGAVERPLVTVVPLGYPAEGLLKIAKPEPGAVLLEGGPAMGKIVEPESAYVAKHVSGYTVLPGDSPVIAHLRNTLAVNRRRSLTACIQCQLCTDACPRWLAGQEVRPHLWMRALCLGTGFDRLAGDLWGCCACGVCELYACPEGLSPRRVAVEVRERMPRPPRDDTPPGDRPLFGERHPPTRRLMGRMGIGDYARPAEWVEAPPVDSLKISLLQGTGSPAAPVVERGDGVRAGEKIAEATAEVSVPLHAPADGTVVEVTATHIGIEVRR